MAASAPSVWRVLKPSAAAAASNQRPAALPRGQFRPRCSIACNSRRAAGSPTCGAKRGTISSPRPAACITAAARRQGSRAAASPPGRASGARWSMRHQREPSPTQSSSPPQALPSLPSPTPSSAMPITGTSTPCSARATAMWAWWCCTATAGTPSRRASARAWRVLWKSGCRSCATACSGAVARSSSASIESASALQADASLRSPCNSDQWTRSPSSRQRGSSGRRHRPAPWPARCAAVAASS